MIGLLLRLIYLLFYLDIERTLLGIGRWFDVDRLV